MDPILNQTSYADSDHIQRNLRPLLKKLAIGLLIVGAVGTVVGIFVWPVPQMMVAHNVRAVEDQYNANNFDEALSILDEYLKKDSENPAYLIKKSLILAEKGKQSFETETYGPRAVSAAEDAIALHPNESEAYRALGYAYEVQEQYEAAHAQYDKALSIDGENARALYGKGHSYELTGDMIKAEEHYRSALLKDPTFDQGYVGVARALIYKGEYDTADEILTKAFWLTHNIRLKAEALTLIAKSAIARNDIEKALNASEQATIIDPSYPLGWYMHGTALYEDSLDERKYKDASARLALVSRSIQHLQQAVRLNPGQSIVYLQLGTELDTFKRPFEASEAFRQGIAAVDSDVTLSATEKVTLKRALEDALLELIQTNGTLATPQRI